MVLWATVRLGSRAFCPDLLGPLPIWEDDLEAEPSVEAEWAEAAQLPAELELAERTESQAEGPAEIPEEIVQERDVVMRNGSIYDRETGEKIGSVAEPKREVVEAVSSPAPAPAANGKPAPAAEREMTVPRNPKSIRTIDDLMAAVKEDFGYEEPQALKAMGFSNRRDIGPGLDEYYVQVAYEASLK
jgi:hypothetical protein